MLYFTMVVDESLRMNFFRPVDQTAIVSARYGSLCFSSVSLSWCCYSFAFHGLAACRWYVSASKAFVFPLKSKFASMFVHDASTL